ncbi:MAG TPA: glycosyltransferase [Kiritimatiellia bacterium]|nr:glycosyltransferase [Kiritimatiellia bacterium]
MTAKISFLVPDINGPVLGPVTVLAGHLSGTYDVEIVGPDLGHGVCPMYRGAWNYRVISCPKIYRFPDYIWESRKLCRAIKGDITIAVKAVGDTVPLALWRRWRHGAKAMVYLDEWDGAIMAQKDPLERWRHRLRHMHHPLDESYYPSVERLIPRLDHVISTSTFLQKKFGGSIVPMGVDCSFFSPRPLDESSALKKSLGLDANKVIVFGGVVRPHKGIEELLGALASLNDPAVRFVIVGPINEHVQKLIANPAFAPLIVTLGPKPRTEMPDYLSLADLVILPLNNSLLARSQVPCKVFEAMSMALPILTSDVSDMSLILDGCGWTTPHGDEAAMAASIRYILDHPAEAREKGRVAREKCKRNYSREVARDLLLEIVGGML